jgi:phosphotransferase system HPr (HPr) family protein
MAQRTVVVGSTSGLHARPAAVFVKAAAAQAVPVRLRVGERPPVDARSILAVLAQKVKQGTEVTLEAEGDGADGALEELAALLARNLDEEGEGDA